MIPLNDRWKKKNEYEEEEQSSFMIWKTGEDIRS